MASLPVIVANDTPAAGAGSPGASRLLVLVPDLDIDEVDLAQRVWSLAEPRGLPVLYLGISAEPDRESLVRRRLATLAAITRDNRIQVEMRCPPIHNWAEAIADVSRPGDLIVCPPEQATFPPWNDHRSVRPNRAPVHVLPDLRVMRQPDRNHRLMRLVFWPVAVAILAACFWLQTRIDLSTEGIARIVLLSLSVVVEGGLLLFWHSAMS